MYQNIFVNRNKKDVTVHLWDDEIGYKKLTHKTYAYKKSPTGMYRSLYGDKLKKVKFWSEDDLKQKLMYESDVPIETRVLVDTYPDTDDVSRGHKTLVIDIEVEVTDGFPEPLRADNKITSIAIYDDIMNVYTVFVLSSNKLN